MSFILRLEEFKLFKPGWYDGEGLAFDHDGISWIQQYQDFLLDPKIFPSLDGQIVFQWRNSNILATLEVDIIAKTGYYHYLDIMKKTAMDTNFDLKKYSEWERLKKQLKNKGF